DTSSIHSQSFPDQQNCKPPDVEEPQSQLFPAFVSCLTSWVSSFYAKHSLWINICGFTVLFLLYNVFLGFAISTTWKHTHSWCDGVRFLILLTIIVYITLLYYHVFKRWLLKPLRRFFSPATDLFARIFKYRYTSSVIWVSILAAVIVFLIIDTKDNRSRLVSAGGLLVLLFFGYLFSAHRTKVVWRHVFWGVFLQFLFGLAILRWHVGKEVFNCISEKVKRFLEFTDYGSEFVFGYLVSGDLKDVTSKQISVFAFSVLSVILFFSLCISILYYYGIMQWMVIKIGCFLQVTVGTTACESMNAAGNIFLGMTEAPLMIKPFLPIMTKSELHAVLTGGFATIAGSVLAAYVKFNVNPSHLLSASVMSAPAALAFSKLFYPETEESRTHAKDIKIDKGTERNAIEAATNGASTAIALVANIAANLIAFLAFIRFLDAICTWIGLLVGWDFISFEWLLSKAFVPLAFLMGVEWNECEQVARLIGLKTVVNEFIAYKQLGEMKTLSPRSQAIAVYALCGFSNIGSIGIQLGALGAMAPERKSDLASLAVRAVIAGSTACFMTACVAGTLLEEVSYSI
ncbi:solute carrier family 28 member 3-like, partial [Limulus polyphemus]|uniref:Sodium/nucleoside cotransporter n=1 Tax=Limulus polyphemus TaxID=6850 RepID=A0ABM1RXV7_LIMPO